MHLPVSQSMFPTAAPYKELCACLADGRSKSSSQQLCHLQSRLLQQSVGRAPRYQLDRLQSVRNTVARLLVGAKKQDSIRHVLRDRLHWLPVQQRIQFKLCLLTFTALHGLAPT